MPDENIPCGYFCQAHSRDRELNGKGVGETGVPPCRKVLKTERLSGSELLYSDERRSLPCPQHCRKT